MRNVVLLICILLNTSYGWAQISRYHMDLKQNVLESQISIQSPEVAEMSRYVDRPVAYYNGTTSVSIPLCEVMAYDIKLPISLSYSSTGFKPSQEATWVGLGWHLSMNASISRYIKCADDFLEYDLQRKGYYYKIQGYYGSSKYKESEYVKRVVASPCPVVGCGATLSCPHIDYENELIIDSEPDIFNFSLWNGGDKFFLSQDKDPSKPQGIFMDRLAGYVLHILKDKDNKYYFELIAKDGTLYEFKKRELTYTYSYGNGTDDNIHITGGYDGTSHDLHASSWFLTKIITPLKKTINFMYEDEDFDAVSNETCVKYTDMNRDVAYNDGTPEYNISYFDDGGSSLTNKDAIYSWTKNKIKTARLKEINWDGGKICFLSSSREDMYHDIYAPKTPQKLDKIVVYNSSNEVVHQYKFNYGYFGANQEIAAWEEEDLYKRLKLLSIEDELTPNFKYSFEYNESQDFPSKMSKSLDYWGYYNGKDYGRKYFCKIFDIETKKFYDGAVKDSEFETSMLGMLTGITHPTGAKETFSYEPNRYMWTEYVQTGGIKKISSIPQMLVGNDNRYGKTEDSREYKADSTLLLKITGHLSILNPNSSYGTGLTLLTVKGIDSDNSSIVEYIYMPYDPNMSTTQDIEKTITLSKKGRYQITAHKPGFQGVAVWEMDLYDSKPLGYYTKEVEKQGAGLRIKSITGAGKDRLFSYSMGKLLVDPILFLKKVIKGRRLAYDGEYSVVGVEFPRFLDLIQFSESSIPLSTFAKGYELGYDDVTETVIGDNKNIKTTYYYRNDKEQRQTLNPYQSTRPVFTNGLLTHKTIVENDKTVYSELMYYTGASSAKVNAYDYTYTWGLIPLPEHRFYCYYPSSTTITYDGIYTNSSYSYKDDINKNSFLLEKACTSLKDQTDKTLYTYNSESSDPVCLLMTQANIIVPIKEVSYVGDKVVSGKKLDYQYHEESQLFLPKKLWYLKPNSNPDNNSSYYEVITYDKYDKNGNIVQMTQSGIPSVYIWGYKGQYPIAEIKNCSFETLTNYINEQTLKSISEKTEPSTSDWALIDNIRGFIKNNRLNSSFSFYKYKPQVGITFQKAPNGWVNCFDFDEAGRLTKIREHGASGLVLQQINYNYKNN